MKNQLYLQLRYQAIKLYLNTLYPLVLKRRAKSIGKKERIEVVFFAINVAMWRYQGVYDLLSKDNRFNCHIVLTSARQYANEQRESNLNLLRSFFSSKGISYHDYDEKTDTGYDVKGLINPDILFYPQPYESQYPENHSFENFTNKLLCYIPYAFNVIKSDYWLYDFRLHNLAWKVYCPIESELKNAQKEARNHGRNWIVSGYSNLDRYLSEDSLDVWKIKDRTLKRLIWAPHFTLETNENWLGSRSNFLRLSDLMLEIAASHKDVLQIAFKPHPWLKSVLYEHPDWGRTKTDEYYNQWANGANTQLETGDFVDLFKTSDAMIHDSGSFTAEYLFVNKPVAFITQDIEGLLKKHSELGCAALRQHYIVRNESEVRSFINDVVLGGQDTMLSQRTEFFETVLKPNVTGSTSQFIVNDIKKSLCIEGH